MKLPRIIFSALRGGSGKTLISWGSVAALRSQGLSVTPFKKGPDYIDAGWLAFAAGRYCYNLDTFMVNPDDVLKSFLFHTSENDIAIIEGNRGLYDGIDTEGPPPARQSLRNCLTLPLFSVLTVQNPHAPWLPRCWDVFTLTRM